MDPVSLIAPAVAVVSLGFNIFQGLRTYRLSRRIATNQGQLNSPDLKLSFQGYDLDTPFVILAPIREDRLIEFPAVLRVGNEGAKTAREIELILRIPKPLFYGGSKNVKFTTDSPKDSYALRPIASSENLETLMMSAASLNPGAGTGIEWTLSLMHETLHTVRFAAEFADQTKGVAVKVALQWVLDVVVTQADRPALSARISITVLDTTELGPTETLRRYNRTFGRPVSAKHWPRTTIFEGRHTVAFVVPEETLERNPEQRHEAIFRIKDGGMSFYDGATTPNGFCFPGLDVFPIDPPPTDAKITRVRPRS
jgi:hypothetical protein